LDFVRSAVIFSLRRVGFAWIREDAVIRTSPARITITWAEAETQTRPRKTLQKDGVIAVVTTASRLTERHGNSPGRSSSGGQHAVIVDVEPSTAVRQAEVTAAKSMIERAHECLEL
jgi:hypothetical protein